MYDCMQVIWFFFAKFSNWKDIFPVQAGMWAWQIYRDNYCDKVYAFSFVITRSHWLGRDAHFIWCQKFSKLMNSSAATSVSDTHLAYISGNHIFGEGWVCVLTPGTHGEPRIAISFIIAHRPWRRHCCLRSDPCALLIKRLYSLSSPEPIT